jgi:hypothetical protein
MATSDERLADGGSAFATSRNQAASKIVDDLNRIVD